MADKDNNRRRLSHKPSSMFSRTHSAAWAGPVGGLGGLILAAASQPALAACSASGTLTPGTIVTCDSTSTQSSRVGQGPGADNITVNVNPNAQIQVTNANSISLGNNANITVNSGAVVQTTTTTQGGGQYGDGFNTIDVNNNSKVTIQAGGSVITSGVDGIVRSDQSLWLRQHHHQLWPDPGWLKHRALVSERQYQRIKSGQYGR